MDSLYGDPQFGSIFDQKPSVDNLIGTNVEIIIKK